MEKKIINYYKFKQYKDFNKTIVCLAFAMILLPIIVYLIRLVFPNMIRCLYYEITSKPCPFCGFTSDFRNILKGNIFAYKYNMLSVPFLIGGIIEVVARIFILKETSEVKINKIIKYDLIVHIILFLIVLIYIISFFIFDLRRF